MSGRILVSILLTLFSFICQATTTDSRVVQKNSGPEYRFFVVPLLPQVAMHTAWAPLLERVSQESGVRLRLEIPPTIPAFEALTFKGLPDFAFLNPYHAVVFRKSGGYIPLIRDNGDLLQGMLFVRKDSPFRTIKDLNGTTIAFPAPNAFVASLYMRALLEREGVHFEATYAGTHTNVYRYVIYGQAAAGGGVNKSWERELPQVRDQMRSIYATPKTAPHPVVAHPRVPPLIQKKVADAFLHLAETESGRALLDAAQLSKPIKADYARDYQPLESLGLERYFVYSGD